MHTKRLANRSYLQAFSNVAIRITAKKTWRTKRGEKAVKRSVQFESCLPNLAPSNFMIFPKLKNIIKEQIFRNVIAIQKKCDTCFNLLTSYGAYRRLICFRYIQRLRKPDIKCSNMDYEFEQLSISEYSEIIVEFGYTKAYFKLSRN